MNYFFYVYNLCGKFHNFFHCEGSGMEEVETIYLFERETLARPRATLKWKLIGRTRSPTCKHASMCIVYAKGGWSENERQVWEEGYYSIRGPLYFFPFFCRPLILAFLFSLFLLVTSRAFLYSSVLSTSFSFYLRTIYYLLSLLEFWLKVIIDLEKKIVENCQKLSNSKSWHFRIKYFEFKF